MLILRLRCPLDVSELIPLEVSNNTLTKLLNYRKSKMRNILLLVSRFVKKN